MGLIYNGKGFIAGLPARDLSDDEVKEYGGLTRLLNTGLYEREAKSQQPKREDKQEVVDLEDKSEEQD